MQSKKLKKKIMGCNLEFKIMQRDKMKLNETKKGDFIMINDAINYDNLALTEIQMSDNLGSTSTKEKLQKIEVEIGRNTSVDKHCNSPQNNKSNEQN